MMVPVPRWLGDRTASRSQRGAVTAEAAMVLPLLVIVAAALAWIIGFGVVQARVQDAAREGARVAARGESDARAEAFAAKVAPSGSTIDVVRGDGQVSVTVVAGLSPRGLLGFLRGPTARARAVSADEGTGLAAPR